MLSENKNFIWKDELQEMIYPIQKKNNQKVHCIDWRKIIIDWKKEILKEWLSYPGGQMWILTTVLSVFDNLIWVEDILWKDYRNNIINIVKSFFWWEINYHTDDHCWCGKIWCGHLDLLFENKKNYFISRQSKDLVLENIKSCSKKAVEVLTGNHFEKWLLVIKWESGFWISNFDLKWNSYFTLTRSSNEELLFDLAKYIIANSKSSYFDSPKVLFELFKDSRNYQLNNTVSTLAPWAPSAKIYINTKWLIKHIIYENN